MHAIICSSFGPPDVMQWTEVPTPQPAFGEILIKVAAAGVNRADTMQRKGKYPPPHGASDIIGLEVSGEVVQLGENTSRPASAEAKLRLSAGRWKIGDKVCALLSGGGYAEYVTVCEGQCLPVPKNLSMVEAALLPEALITVWANLFEAGGAQAGETVLVHGGSSGIGTTAIQMAKLSGIKIIATVGSDDKAEACRKLGADQVINYKNEDFVEATMQATNGHGVNVVLDMIGGDYVNRNLSAMAPFGRHVSIATQQGKISSIDMRLIMQKRLMVTGSTLRARSTAEKTRLVGEIERKVWPWVVNGQLKPLVYKAYPIKIAAEAHKMMESGQHIGKMALEVVS